MLIRARRAHGQLGWGAPIHVLKAFWRCGAPGADAVVPARDSRRTSTCRVLLTAGVRGTLTIQATIDVPISVTVGTTYRIGLPVAVSCARGVAIPLTVLEAVEEVLAVAEGDLRAIWDNVLLDDRGVSPAARTAIRGRDRRERGRDHDERRERSHQSASCGPASHLRGRRACQAGHGATTIGCRVRGAPTRGCRSPAPRPAGARAGKLCQPRAMGQTASLRERR